MESRSILVLLLAVSLFASLGCIGEKTFSSDRQETLLSSDSQDLDGDGQWDYAVYEFSTVTEDQALGIKRFFSVSAKKDSQYTELREGLTDIDLLAADDSLEDFSIEKTLAEESCLQEIGLISFSCADPGTCAKLCSASTITCKNIASKYADFLGGSMVYYVQDNSRIDSSIREARTMVLGLRTASAEEKNRYLSKISQAASKAASLNANPLAFHPALSLCENSGYGVEKLISAAGVFGNYSTSVAEYDYIMTLQVDSVSGGGLGSHVSGIVVEDHVPMSIISSPQEISSYQDISVSGGGDAAIRWSSSASSDSYVMYYKFSSTAAPEDVAAMLRTPSVSLKTFDLSFLGPVDLLYNLFLDISGNHYIAIGLAFGVFLSFILLLYTMVLLVINVVQAELGGRQFPVAVKKAFGKTQVRWKVEGTVAIALLIAGIAVSTVIAPDPLARMDLFSLGGYLVTEPFAFVGAALVLLGVVMGYGAAENFVKIIMLERIYGITIREERGAYLAKLTELREKLEKLEKMIETYRAEEFDVSDEYDVATSISKSKLTEFEKKMTPRSKALVEEYLSRVESAMEKLEDKKKMADEKWQTWKEYIGKVLSERNEIYASSLTAVPASMRLWVLNKYMKEAAEEGLVFERDVLKKKKVSPLFTLKEMTSAGLLKGGIVFSGNNVVASWLEKGKSPTVHMALVFKLRNYLSSLGRNMGLGDLLSFVAVGSDTVFVLLRDGGREAALFVSKDRFRDAIEEWKKKSKMLGEEG